MGRQLSYQRLFLGTIEEQRRGPNPAPGAPIGRTGREETPMAVPEMLQLAGQFGPMAICGVVRFPVDETRQYIKRVVYGNMTRNGGSRSNRNPLSARRRRCDLRIGGKVADEGVLSNRTLALTSDLRPR